MTITFLQTIYLWILFLRRRQRRGKLWPLPACASSEVSGCLSLWETGCWSGFCWSGFCQASVWSRRSPCRFFYMRRTTSLLKSLSHYFLLNNTWVNISCVFSRPYPFYNLLQWSFLLVKKVMIWILSRLLWAQGRLFSLILSPGQPQTLTYNEAEGWVSPRKSLEGKIRDLPWGGGMRKIQTPLTQ